MLQNFSVIFRGTYGMKVDIKNRVPVGNKYSSGQSGVATRLRNASRLSVISFNIVQNVERKLRFRFTAAYK